MKGEKGIHPQFFRNSYRYNLIHNGADNDLADLKLRIANINQYRGFTFEHLRDFEAQIYKRKFSEHEIANFIDWYKNNFRLYEHLSDYVKDIIVKLLESNSLETHYVSKRTKTISSFEEKIRNGINFSPRDMQDLSGIRVICFTRTDTEKVSEIIERTFDIDKKNSIDKTKLLGDSKMGYKSIQYVAKLPPSRYEQEEHRLYKGRRFEIQIRTILQHAWAQISHDDIYKQVGTSNEIKRRFNLVSSLLEVADNELEELHNLRHD